VETEADLTLQNPTSLTKPANSLHAKTLRSFVPVRDLLWLPDQQTGVSTTRVVMQCFCARLYQKAVRRTGTQLLLWLRCAGCRGPLSHHARDYYAELFMQ